MASRARKVFGSFKKRAPEPAIHIYEYLFHWQVFIGLAFPYEGPAPLEAIAQGSVFINPKVGLCAVDEWVQAAEIRRKSTGYSHRSEKP